MRTPPQTIFFCIYRSTEDTTAAPDGTSEAVYFAKKNCKLKKNHKSKQFVLRKKSTVRPNRNRTLPSVALTGKF